MSTPNLRLAVRSLAKSPVFTAVAVLSLALALAVNVTVFALLDAVRFPVLPYHDAGRAYTIRYTASGKNSSSYQERFDALAHGLQSADAVVPYYMVSASVEHDNSIEDEFVSSASPQLFDILGVRPELGRAFDESDTRPGALPVVMISYELWIRMFGEQALTKHLMLTVDRADYEVIGVMPRGMHFPVNDVWLPPGALVGDSTMKRFGPIAVVRAKPGVTRVRLESEMNVVMAGLNAAVAPRSAVAGRLISFTGRNTGGGMASWEAVKVSFVVVATVLLIACANLGTMLLARGMARRREIAIRMALGASRRAIATQVLVECAIIVGVGVGLGILLTVWAVHLLPHYAAQYAPSIGDMQPTPSWRVFAFAGTVASVTLLLATALPAWRAAGVDPAEPLKEGAGSSARIRDRYNPLIVVEVALSTALLMVAALFTLLLTELAGFDFSYAAKQLQVASLDVRKDALPSDTAVERFYDDLVVRMRGVPSVRGVATSRAEKPAGGMVFAEAGLNGDHWMNLSGYTAVSPSYLSTLGIPIVEGRDFQPGDRGGGGGNTTGTVIVDDSAAHRLWPELQSPVGRMIKLGTRDSNLPWLRVVGVARSVEFQPRSDAGLPPEPKIYVLYGHDAGRDRDLVVRGDGVGGVAGQAQLGVAIRHEIESAAPWIRTRRVHRWLEGYDQSRQTSGFFASLFTAFGVFGLVLCAVGFYGVLAYSVSRRLRELATRIALGAQPRHITRTVLHDCAVTVLAGIGIGAFLALFATAGMVGAMLHPQYELVLALIAAEALLLSTAVVACLGPIRQAIRANPVDILRAC